MNITSFFSHTIKKEEKQMKKSKKDYPVTPAYEDIMFNEAGSSNECTDFYNADSLYFFNVS